MSAVRYEFTDAFEEKILALAMRDATFKIRTESLVAPDYFNEEARGALFALWEEHWRRYRSIPSPTVAVKMLADGFRDGVLRDEIKDEIKDAFKAAYRTDLSDRDYVVDEVASFAKHQAIINAMGDSVDLLDKRDFEAIERKLTQALSVAPNEEGDSSDLFDGDAIAARAHRRGQIAKGVVKRGISTGVKELDDALLHGGWGVEELSVIMGGAKRGKSFWLMNAGVNAALAGHSVLHVSLENSKEVTEDRADAYVSQIETNDLVQRLEDARDHVERRSASGVGRYLIHAYGPGVFRPSDLRRLVERYRSRSILFDLIVVDYWDIMAPDQRYRDDKIAESASIGMGLRAIARDEKCAMLTAVQTNREGYRAHVAGAEHVAEDFNKVRLADLLISVNADEDELAANEARLFMAAGRNQEDGYTMTVKRNLAKATFIEKVLGSGSI